MTDEELVCPRCAQSHPSDERFCRRCNMPLVFAGADAEQEITPGPLAQQARKIKPQYAEGSLVRVVSAANQAEGEFIQGMLLEEGVPSILKRSMGFDVPDMLAAGRRDVMVPMSGYAVAREVLLQAELVDAEIPRTPTAQIVKFMLVALLIVAVIAVLVGRLGA